ncbi:hypothetical protein GCM10007874_38180 [Labrys miyagiensis]|uniref:Transposase n=1 Tax=Labrys miyagiensis TaxID=346912 RepID=A0ABQ6CKB6_9HYPH|nr:hypothetical protein [Labrys miyagiensis]GLS20801.1 hypothetical protein GCM10007874_38180 [Labrys miyagiensis]
MLIFAEKRDNSDWTQARLRQNAGRAPSLPPPRARRRRLFDDPHLLVDSIKVKTPAFRRPERDNHTVTPQDWC